MTPADYNETAAATDDQIQEMLDVVRTESGANAIFIVNDGGMIIGESGDLGVDTTALSALISASFAATEEIARLVEEKNFSKLTHQGKNLNLFICKSGATHILITVFGRNTNLGLVKLYVERAAELLAEILDAQLGLSSAGSDREAEVHKATLAAAEAEAAGFIENMQDQQIDVSSQKTKEASGADDSSAETSDSDSEDLPDWMSEKS
ncbi:roadblock/LC7 domain-containing protein [Calditrichota bacterium]